MTRGRNKTGHRPRSFDLTKKSHIKKSEHSQPKLKSQKLKLPDPLREPIVCDSLSEFACISLLEKYTTWKAIQGNTFQVPIGRCTFDFLIDECLVEYHPISLKREFLTESLHKILHATKKLDRTSKLTLFTCLVDEFKAQYKKRREQVASADPKYKSHQVVCVYSPEEFVEKIIIPNSKFSNITIESLCLEFRELQKQNKKLL